LAAVTLLFEGNKDEQDELHKRTLATAKKFNGMAAGAENGMRGYLLTFLLPICEILAVNTRFLPKVLKPVCSGVMSAHCASV
jgi:alkyldihydroxyacetonephosphate synthase